MPRNWVVIINTTSLFWCWSGLASLKLDDVTASLIKHHTHITGLAVNRNLKKKKTEKINLNPSV